VLELNPKEKRITIKKGEPVCRVLPVRRDTYFASHMSPAMFDEFYERSQRWLTVHGKPTDDKTTMDITRTYVKQQVRAKFVVLD
jgi:predicted HD phosphohydrolase